MTEKEGRSRENAAGGAEPRAVQLDVGLTSDRGPNRDLNEDYVEYYIPPDEAQSRSKGALFVVADGMGGHLAGEVASREAVRRVIKEYYADPAQDPGTCLGRAVRAANNLVYQLASADPDKAGMGTTLVAAVVIGSRVYVANVGDSRAYGISRDQIAQITQDHSWVEEQIRAGILTRERAQNHPQRNLITRALGRRRTVDVDLFEGKLLPGDALLLCSDGVCGPLSDEEMARAIRSLPPGRAAQQLVGQAAAAGGTDNASALIVRAVAAVDQPEVRPRPPAEPADPVQRSTRPGGQRWILAVAGACFALCLLGAAILVPALTQRLVGDPAAAPIIAPLRDSRLDGSQPDQVAAYLGYADAQQMVDAHAGQLALQNLGAAELKPAAPGVYLSGTARDWSCEQQACSFRMEVAGTEYAVTYPAPGQMGVDLGGLPVRVYGAQQEQEGQLTVAAQLIEQGSHWWAWWQHPAWTLVHQIGSWEQSVWAYSIIDQSPNGLIEPDQIPGLQKGTRVLLHGLWHIEEQPMSFGQDQIFVLQGTTYLPVQEQPTLPLPTSTLQPTQTMQLEQHLGIEYASSGKPALP